MCSAVLNQTQSFKEQDGEDLTEIKHRFWSSWVGRVSYLWGRGGKRKSRGQTPLLLRLVRLTAPCRPGGGAALQRPLPAGRRSRPAAPPAGRQEPPCSAPCRPGGGAVWLSCFSNRKLWRVFCYFTSTHLHIGGKCCTFYSITFDEFSY